MRSLHRLSEVISKHSNVIDVKPRDVILGPCRIILSQVDFYGISIYICSNFKIFKAFYDVILRPFDDIILRCFGVILEPYMRHFNAV
jgi:hypothetical protein